MKSYDIRPKDKVSEYIQTGAEFFVVDMKRKKVYPSQDLRLSELSEKLESDECFIIREYEI
jgi:hypothetical protein